MFETDPTLKPVIQTLSKKGTGHFSPGKQDVRRSCELSCCHDVILVSRSGFLKCLSESSDQQWSSSSQKTVQYLSVVQCFSLSAVSYTGRLRHSVNWAATKESTSQQCVHTEWVWIHNWRSSHIPPFWWVLLIVEVRFFIFHMNLLYTPIKTLQLLTTISSLTAKTTHPSSYREGFSVFLFSDVLSGCGYFLKLQTEDGVRKHFISWALKDDNKAQLLWM